MGTNLKIVELVGIPGSGKSYFIHNSDRANRKKYKIFFYHDLIEEYIKNKFKIFSFFHILPYKMRNKIYCKIYYLKKFDVQFQKQFVQKEKELFNFIKKKLQNAQ